MALTHRSIKKGRTHPIGWIGLFSNRVCLISIQYVDLILSSIFSQSYTNFKSFLVHVKESWGHGILDNTYG